MNKQIVIITGMSGAGKTSALKDFEDLGYFCVDNMPPKLLPKLMRIVKFSKSIKNAAIALDLRSKSLYQGAAKFLYQVLSQDSAKVVFMDASDEQLISRFKEHRKAHPLAVNSRIRVGVNRERKFLKPVRKNSSIIWDTTNLAPKDLAARISNNFRPDLEPKFHLDVMSFGFKYGLPLDADLITDVRFLPNPFYVNKLKNKTGMDKPVYDYVMNSKVTEGFYRRFISLLKYSIPNYIKEGKPSLTIAIGCTGGQHRSVAMAERVGKALRADYPVNIYHRDAYRDINSGRYASKKEK